MNILWAARHPSLLVFTEEYKEWEAAPNTKLHLTVDTPDENWDKNVGLITQLLDKSFPITGKHDQHNLRAAHYDPFRY